MRNPRHYTMLAELLADLLLWGGLLLVSVSLCAGLVYALLAIAGLEVRHG